MTEPLLTPEDYLLRLPENRRTALQQLRTVFLENLPPGFAEVISYGMIGYVVPHELYPAGYHVDPHLPLPFINIGAQKSHLAVYHFGLYADTRLLQWLQEAYTTQYQRKLDTGKSCLRFKNLQFIPYDLLGELATRMTVEEWIQCYEMQVKRR